jgi:cytochrome c peroxidase
MQRLGGAGMEPAEIDAISAYLQAIPAPRAPSRDLAQITRGKALFTSDELGCTSCHGGARHTDRARHQLSGDLASVDTPALIGLAASAPYFHDGSAATLSTLLRDAGKVHGMAETASLSDREIEDLSAFLDTL